ncbi:cellulose binding domain-containing protein [Glycomyces luteolus]|uniref:Cellulose binding domain-containing protein n=1 Tax=Glycomyces luteolus TaxID=2670330 RepID=A0A9X3P8Q9_9ACTN|nr:cellulose binding domain-containing protein [Glycomyces luteolus]MDA1359033.1 cellulose binding domain-containing protein [Glycomyces luteolus]
MRPWMDRAVLRGRIHGRLMLVLVAVAVLASVAAIWQFSALREDHDPDLADFGEPAATDESSDSALDGSSVEAPETPSPAVSESPTEAASSSAPATESSDSGEAADSSPQCTASLTLDSEWDGSVSVAVTIANTGAEAIDGWEIQIGIKHLSVTTTWGLTHIEGERYGDILLNAAIDQGGSVDASFQADVQGRYEIPATVPCTPA